jgi:N-acetylglucosaminyl-diphospho-decaprenol L-rhamnosyltransferase
VTVVTVTHNSAHVLTNLLRSIPSHIPVIVVDNASADDSVAEARRWPNVTVEHLPVNRGFSVACNRGAALAATPFLFFVNPDASLEPETIPALLSAAAVYPPRSALNPVFLDELGYLNLRAPTRFLARTRGPRAARPDGDIPLNVLHGAALFIRAEHFEKVGGFDEGIFLYFEDDDLSLRLLQAGFGLYHIHDARVHHRGGASTPPSPALTRFKNFHWMRSYRYVAEKHGAPIARIPMMGRVAYRWLRSVAVMDAAERQKYEGRWQALIHR